MSILQSRRYFPYRGAIAARVTLGVGAPDVIVSDEKTQGTDGGTFTTGAERQRDLNTEVRDVNAYCTVSANTFSLVAGTWYIEWSAPAFKVGAHISYLHNNTDSVYYADYYSTEFSSSTSGDVQTQSVGSAVVTIGGTKTLALYHLCGATKAGNGMGVASNLSVEIYAVIRAWKIA